jgi:hypothetical protein
MLFEDQNESVRPRPTAFSIKDKSYADSYSVNLSYSLKSKKRRSHNTEAGRTNFDSRTYV